jgi:hypothetical protein
MHALDDDEKPSVAMRAAIVFMQNIYVFHHRQTCHTSAKKLAEIPIVCERPDSKSRPARHVWHCGAAIACVVTYGFLGADGLALRLIETPRIK